MSFAGWPSSKRSRLAEGETRRSADFEERAQRATGQVALRRVFVSRSFLECTPELRVESNGHDLGWAIAEARPASAAELGDVVAAFGLVDEAELEERVAVLEAVELGLAGGLVAHPYG